MVYKDIKYNELSADMLNQLRKGAFLTTKVENKINTMTIAWGGINIVWNKNVFVVYVRYTRDTYKMLENGHVFTISVPLNNDLKEKLAYCGTKSGKDVDKIQRCNLILIAGRKVNTPVLKECELHYECKVIYKQAMEPGMIPQEIKDKHYKNNDYHVIYYGEIVDSYILEGE